MKRKFLKAQKNSFFEKKFINLLFITLFLLKPGNIQATQEVTPDKQPHVTEEVKKYPVPSIADLTPLVAEMSGRKAVLEQEMPDKSNLKTVEESFSIIANRLKNLRLASIATISGSRSRCRHS